MSRPNPRVVQHAIENWLIAEQLQLTALAALASEHDVSESVALDTLNDPVERERLLLEVGGDPKAIKPHLYFLYFAKRPTNANPNKAG